MIPAGFEYVVPGTLEEATSLLKEHGEEAKILAGGHSLIPLLKLRLAQPGTLIDLRKLVELKTIRMDGETLSIGALCTHHQVASSELVGEACPLLQQAAASIGDAQVRNLGTIGGALAHGDPAADYPAAVLATEARIGSRSADGSRETAASDFFIDMLVTALEPGEILTEIRIPAVRDAGACYLKMEQRASGFAIVGAAALVQVQNGSFSSLRLAFNGVASRPYRAAAVEAALEGQDTSAERVAEACSRSAEGVELLGDIHASEAYRAHLATVYGRRAIQAALDQVS